MPDNHKAAVRAAKRSSRFWEAQAHFTTQEYAPLVEAAQALVDAIDNVSGANAYGLDHEMAALRAALKETV